MASESERTDRVLTSLDTAVRVTTEVIGHIKGMTRELEVVKESQEKGFAAMRDTFNAQLSALHDEMRSNSAHLDNLIRETVVTNTILQEDMATRQAAESERRKIETEERDWRRKIEQDEREWRRTLESRQLELESRQLERKEKVEDDNRSMVKKAAEEGWAIVKTPLAYLLAGVIFFIVVRYFGVPSQVATPVLPGPVQQQFHQP